MNLSVRSLALVTVLLLSASTFAQISAPLSVKVLSARTVFIDNQSGFDRARDEFVDELGKWQRVEIVYNRFGADLVAVLAADRTAMTSQLTLVDDKTGESVWSNSASWSEQGGMRDLMRDLKQRIDGQERTPQR